MATEQATVSFLLEHRQREAIEALIAADSAMAVALADFARDSRFDRFALPPGSRFPFAGPDVAVPLPPSFRVDTTVWPRSSTHIEFVARARGRSQAERRLVATIARGGDPYIPAALYLAARDPSLTLSGKLAITGSKARNDRVPGLATQSQAHGEAMRQQIFAAGDILDGAPPVAAAQWGLLDEILGHVRDTAAPLPELVVGSFAPAVHSSQGAVRAHSVSGGGIWLVDGDLTLSEEFVFEGLLVVLGDLHVDDGARVRVDGGLILAAPGRLLNNRGDLSITYKSNSLRAVDELQPGLLHRRAHLIGWRDDS